MAEAVVRGVRLNYLLLGDDGPVIALSPGGRRPLADAQLLADKFAAAGYRVLLHDRRNCGASEVSFDASASEYDIWADDLQALGEQLGILPLYAGGGSAGGRRALLLALRHPASVKGLLLWRVTGGASAPELSKVYYGDFIRAAQQGGMAAVCATPHFSDCIRARPENRELLLAMDPDAFIRVMEAWQASFLREAKMPVIGASEAQLQGIAVPACVISGDDPIHTREAAQSLHRLIPGCALHENVVGPHLQIDSATAEWGEKRNQVAAIFLNFLSGIGGAAVSAARVR